VRALVVLGIVHKVQTCSSSKLVKRKDLDLTLPQTNVRSYSSQLMLYNNVGHDVQHCRTKRESFCKTLSRIHSHGRCDLFPALTVSR